MVTYEEVRRMLDYDPDTGILTWKVERYRKHPGDVAGCIFTMKNGYKSVNISLNYKRYLAHRIIWLWMTGKWPIEEIDHKDGNGANNKWGNLREATHNQNAKNRSISKANLTGAKGVGIGRKGLYRARIMVNRRDITLGYFKTIEEAAEVRKQASVKYYGEFSRE